MTPRPGKAATLKLVALLLVIVLAGLLLGRGPTSWLSSPDALVDRAAGVTSTWWGPLLFVAGYAVLATLDFSGLVLTLAGGALFGLGWGLVLNTLGANLGASGAFWLARSLGRDGLRTLLGNRLATIDRLTQAHGFLWLVRLRLIPVVPFNLLNFASGLTTMRWSTYAAATAIGILPGTLVYTWFADALVAGSRDASRGALIRVALAGAALIALSFLPSLARRLTRRSAT